MYFIIDYYIICTHVLLLLSSLYSVSVLCCIMILYGVGVTEAEPEAEEADGSVGNAVSGGKRP